MSPRRLHIRQSSTRPRYLFGGDRAVVLVFGSAGLMPAMFGAQIWIRVLGLLVVAGGTFWARAMVKRDPLWRGVWFRRVRRYHQGVWLARSSPFRVNRPMQKERYR